ncbi:MAG: tetratricopeptide repeat protein [Anaerolineae bacterium]
MKKVKRHHVPAAPPLRFQEELARAERLIERGAYREALDILTALNERYPNRPSVLILMADVFFETEDYPNYLQTTYLLYNLTPNDPNIVFNLASVCPVMGFPAFALQLYRQFLKRWPKHEMAAEARERIGQLEEFLKTFISESSFPVDPDILALHDEMRLCMMVGDYANGRKIARKLLAKSPHFAPAFNNLSLISWIEGDLEEAVQTAQKVLDIDPQNFHALSNLSRFFYLQGQPEKAFQYARQLKEIQRDIPELWTKQAEALAFLGDDEGVVSIQYDDQAIAALSPSEAALFYCCRAASEYRLGNTKKARSLWRKALTCEADFPLAIENLENLRRPPHEQFSPWPLPMHYWISPGQLNSLSKILERAASLPEERGMDLIRRYLDEHTHLPFLARPILERGSPETKELVIRLADLSGHPALLEALKEYALGPHDPDEQRLRVAHLLLEHGVIPSGMVRIRMFFTS